MIVRKKIDMNESLNKFFVYCHCEEHQSTEGRWVPAAAGSNPLNNTDITRDCFVTFDSLWSSKLSRNDIVKDLIKNIININLILGQASH